MNEFYAMATMRELWQSKPSTLTAACLYSNFTLLWAAESEGDDTVDPCFWTLKWSSCTIGFWALHGGDPKKNGGDEDDDTVPHPSASNPSCKSIHHDTDPQDRFELWLVLI